MTVSGMAIEEVRELATAFDRAARQLENMRAFVHNRIQARVWLGPAAIQFEFQWTSSSSLQLDEVASALDRCAGELRRHIIEQEDASGIQSGREGDVLDFFELSAAWIDDRLDEGVAWVNDRVNDGVAWVDDRIQDGVEIVDKVVDGVVNRVVAGYRGLETAVDAHIDFALQLASGNWAYAELGAGLLLTLGAGVGLASNLMAGKDLDFFDAGRPTVGPVREIEGAPTTVGPNKRATDQKVDPPTVPTDFRALTFDTMETYDQDGLRVTAIRKAGEVTRYIVAFPGTRSTDFYDLAGYRADPAGENWADAIDLMADGRSTPQEAMSMATLAIIREDMARHGEQGKPEVLLTGHSQGGMIASYLAADPEFREQVQVRAVVAYGAPVQNARVPHDIPVLSLQHGQVTDPASWFMLKPDVVPALDLGGQHAEGMNSQPNLQTVRLPPQSDIGASHEQQSYYNSVRSADRSDSAAIRVFERQAKLQDFYTSDPSQVDGYTATTGRAWK